MIIFTQEQQDIITAKNRVILVEAVAGAGKTTTLAERVLYMLRNKNLEARQVLVLVFTPTAKQVFQRYLAKTGLQNGVRIATYSEFSQSLLKLWEKKEVIDMLPDFLNNFEAIRPWIWKATERAAASVRHDPDYYFDLTNPHAEYIINQLSWLKGTLNLRKLDEEEESDFTLSDALDLPEGLISVCRAYERLRSYSAGQYTFQSEQDLLFDVLNIIKAYPGLPLPRYKMVVADEWHDANAAHMELLNHLVSDGTHLIASGDKEQVIHSWNGADPRFMEDLFQENFPSVCRMPLTVSFRCGPTLGAAAFNLNGKPFSSNRTSDTQINIVSYNPVVITDCAEVVAEAIKNLKNTALSDCVILLRAPHQSIFIENALIKNKIAYVPKGFVSYFYRIEIRMLRGILHVLTGDISNVKDPEEVKEIIKALGTFAGLKYSEADWNDAAEDIVNNRNIMRAFYENRLIKVHPIEENISAASRQWRAKFAVVCDALTANIQEWNAGELLENAAKELGLYDITRRLFVQKDQADAVIKSIAGFVSIAKEMKLNVKEFLNWLDTIKNSSASLKEKTKDKNGQLTISTIEDAKGNEWKCVLMPYLESSEFPKPEADFLEERRLFYVAITRAKEQLMLFVPDGSIKPEAGLNNEASSASNSASNSTSYPALQGSNGMAGIVGVMPVGPSYFVEKLNLKEAKNKGSSVLYTNKFPVHQLSKRVYLDVTSAQEKDVTRMGARWDDVQRKYWILQAEAGRFQKWLPDGYEA